MITGFTGAIIALPQGVAFDTITALVPEAFAVTLLRLIEAVSISHVVATKSNQRINSNQKFVGPGHV